MMRPLIACALVICFSGCIQVDPEDEDATPTPTGTTRTSSPSATPSSSAYPTSAPPLTSASTHPSTPSDAGGRSLTLDPFLWRDFQPISEPGGKPLIALIKIWAEGNEPFPADVVPDRLRVHYGNETWDTSFSNETLSPDSANQTQKVARDGPKWGPDVEVDVEVRIVSASTPERWLVARNVTIQMTQ